jgi:hypothetical protein
MIGEEDNVEEGGVGLSIIYLYVEGQHTSVYPVYCGLQIN